MAVVIITGYHIIIFSNIFSTTLVSYKPREQCFEGEKTWNFSLYLFFAAPRAHINWGGSQRRLACWRALSPHWWKAEHSGQSNAGKRENGEYKDGRGYTISKWPPRRLTLAEQSWRHRQSHSKGDRAMPMPAGTPAVKRESARSKKKVSEMRSCVIFLLICNGGTF